MTSPPLGPAARCPQLGVSTALIAVALFGLLVFVSELAAQHFSVAAYAEPAPVPWARAYEEAIQTPDAILLVGSSRALHGLDPAVVEQQTGRRVFHLGIDGGNPNPILERLAEEHTRHVVVYSYIPQRLYSDDLVGHANTEAFMDELNNPSLLARPEYDLTHWVATHFRSRAPQLQLKELARRVIARQVPEPTFRHIRDDRFSSVIPERIPDGVAEGLEEKFADSVDRDPPFETPAHQVDWLEQIQQEFEAHDASLFVVRLPVSGQVAQSEHEVFPRESFFDLLQGFTHWHYEDDAATANLSCFDGSHLTPDGAQQLSERVGSWLKQRLDGH